MARKKTNPASSGAQNGQELAQDSDIKRIKDEIAELQKTVRTLRYDLSMVNSRIEISNHVNNLLRDQVDKLQQYTRRYSVIMENVPVVQNESTENVETEVKNILQ